MSIDPIFTKIKRVGKTPLHREVEKRVRQLISQSRYQKGELIPNEIEMAEKFGISRHTLRMAIGRLVNEGLLVRTAGLGTRVCTRPVYTDVNAWASFTREMQKQGVEVENFQIKVAMEKADAEVAERLGIEVGTEVLKVARYRGWGGRPTMKAESWIHPDIKLTGKEDYSRPLYEIIQASAGLRPFRSVEEVSVVCDEKEITSALGVKPRSPLLMRKRVVFDAQKNPLEYNINFYLPEAYTLHLELQVSDR